MYGISEVFRVVEAEGPALVSNNWSLTPSELGARDKFPAPVPIVHHT